MSPNGEALELVRQTRSFFARDGAWRPGICAPDSAEKSVWWCLCDLKDRRLGEAYFLEALAAIADACDGRMGEPRRAAAHQDALNAFECAPSRTAADVVAMLERAIALFESGSYVPASYVETVYRPRGARDPARHTRA